MMKDINRQLPSEGRKYAAVDSTWRKIMNTVHSNPKVLVVLEQDKLLQQLQDCNKLLEQIMKGLNDYLDIKRAAFPRFYFLSNEELIGILKPIYIYISMLYFLLFIIYYLMINIYPC